VEVYLNNKRGEAILAQVQVKIARDKNKTEDMEEKEIHKEAGTLLTDISELAKNEN